MENLLTVKIEEANQSDGMVIKTEEMLQVMSGSPNAQQMPKFKTGYTNVERYNVLVRAYIQAHPHLPRQMQYAEAQQVWRSVRMDPEGAYLAVLRSLHGMALMAQANYTVAANDGAAVFETQQELHPLLLQAIDPSYTSPVPAPVPVPIPVSPPPPLLPPPPMAAVSPQFQPSSPQPEPLSPQTLPVISPPKKRIRIRRPRGRPPKVLAQSLPIQRPGKRRGRPPKNKEPVIEVKVPGVKRRPGRQRKRPLPTVQTAEPVPVPTSDHSPVQPVQNTPEKPSSIERSPKVQKTQKSPRSLIISPVASPPPPQPSSNIPEPVIVSVSAHTPVITVNQATNKTYEAVKHEAPAVEQWEPQAGLSFVQGNGLKMILSRVNNGLPLPEYRRRRRKKSKNSPKSESPKDSQKVDAIATLVPLNNATSPTQGQAADSTVMDVDSQIPAPSQPCEYSPDQSFAAAILQYLLDLSELLGSTTSFVISQEIEQSQNGSSNDSVYSGWLVGEQSIGPKLAATVRMSTKSNQVACLNQLVNNEDFKEVVRTPYGRVKPVAVLILEGRKPGELVQFLEETINCFKEWDLDSIILASQPAVGQHVLCTLENNASGNAVSSNGCHSSSDHQIKTKTVEVEQWKNRHLRSGQYYLQIAKCADQHCCPEWRTPLRKILPPQGFLPPPVPFAKGEQGPMAPRFEERDMATYGRLCERLVMESLVPRTAFQELPFDFYCPSARQLLSRQVCFDCGHYFCTQALRKLHSQLLHPGDDKH